MSHLDINALVYDWFKYCNNFQNQASSCSKMVGYILDLVADMYTAGCHITTRLSVKRSLCYSRMYGPMFSVKNLYSY